MQGPHPYKVDIKENKKSSSKYIAITYTMRVSL